MLCNVNHAPHKNIERQAVLLRTSEHQAKFVFRQPLSTAHHETEHPPYERSRRNAGFLLLGS